MPHYLSRQAPWFAFLVHPRTPADLHRWGGGAVIRQLSASEDEFVARALASPPVVLGEALFRPGPVRGEIIAVPALSDGMISPEGRRLVEQAALLAAQRGTRVVGLGALTAPATRGGLSLVGALPPEVTITSGNAYTAWVARENVREAIGILGLSRTARVAVVGCTGSVGTGVSRLLAEDDVELILIGRSEARVQRTLPDLAGRGRVSGDLGDVATADVTLLVTSEPKARLRPEAFGGPAASERVVIDVSQPPNVDRADHARFRRAGVIAVDGGIAAIPGCVSTPELEMPEGSTFACLAETYLFAREGIREHAVGPASVATARMLHRVAERHGVRPRSLGLQAPALVPAGP